MVRAGPRARRRPAPDPARADTQVKAGEVAFLQCDYPEARAHLDPALDLLRRHPADPQAEAIARQRLGSIAREQGRYDEARRLHGESLAIWRRLGEADGVASSLNYLAFVAWLSGDFPEAEAPGLEALTTFRRAGNLRDVAVTLVSLGASALYRGSPTSPPSDSTRR